MILFDVNVLIYAVNPEAANHARYSAWFDEMVGGSESFGASDLVLSGFVRIVTNRKAFPKASTIDEALAIAEGIRAHPNCVIIQPGPRHWNLFVGLCRRVNARGNLVPDAYLAALAIESGSEWITTDRDYARFPGLRWRHPLDE